MGLLPSVGWEKVADRPDEGWLSVMRELASRSVTAIRVQP
jgi:hypothetical protein